MLKWIKRMFTKQPEICGNKVDMIKVTREVEKSVADFASELGGKPVWRVGSNYFPDLLVKSLITDTGTLFEGKFTQNVTGDVEFLYSDDAEPYTIPLERIVAYHCGEYHWRKS